MQNFLRSIFYSPDEPRLRAGWRIFLQFTLLIFFSILFLLPFTEINPTTIIMQSAASFLSVWAARKILDHRDLASLGLQTTPTMTKDFFVGILISGLMMTSIYGILLAAGWLTPSPSSLAIHTPSEIFNNLFIWAGAFIAVGISEELLSRGYHFQNIEEGSNTYWGLFLSAILFSILHGANLNISMPALIGLLASGLFLGYAYLRTRDLWLPIGIHVGWNFFEGPILGFSVSGMDFFRLLNHQISGPELITGGAFGPEAGLILIPGMIIGGWLVYIYTKNRTVKSKTNGNK